MTHFTNSGSGKKRVSFAAPYPGKIMPIQLSKVGGEILCQKDAFLCAAMGTEVSIALYKRLGAGFFGGEGFILQRLKNHRNSDEHDDKAPETQNPGPHFIALVSLLKHIISPDQTLFEHMDRSARPGAVRFKLP